MLNWLPLFLIVLLSACEERPDYPLRIPPEGFLQQEENIAAGQAVFMDKCAWCHGTPAEGRSPRVNQLTPEPATITSPKYRTMDPAYLYWRISTGKQVEPYRSRGSSMPAWGPYFSDATIWQLVAYLRQRPLAAEE